MNLTADGTDIFKQFMSRGSLNPCAEVDLEGYRQAPRGESYSQDFWLETSSYLPEGL